MDKEPSQQQTNTILRGRFILLLEINHSWYSGLSLLWACDLTQSDHAKYRLGEESWQNSDRATSCHLGFSCLFQKAVNSSQHAASFKIKQEDHTLLIPGGKLKLLWKYIQSCIWIYRILGQNSTIFLQNAPPTPSYPIPCHPL